MHALAQSENVYAFPVPAKTSQGLSRSEMTMVFAPEAEIYAQGEVSDSLYQIEFGAVRVYRLLCDGRRQIVSFHFAGETFGFEADSTHSFFAEALMSTKVRIQPRPSSRETSSDLMALALRGMIRAQEHLLVVGRQSSMEKLAAFLIDLCERQGGLEQIELPMTRADIADYLGMTIETVSRSLSKLRAGGTLRLKETRCIEILNPDRLRNMCQ